MARGLIAHQRRTRRNDTRVAQPRKSIPRAGAVPPHTSLAGAKQSLEAQRQTAHREAGIDVLKWSKKLAAARVLKQGSVDSQRSEIAEPLQSRGRAETD